MQKIDTWTKWVPLANLAQKYMLDSIIDDNSEFKIMLTDRNDATKKLSVDFSAKIELWQKTYLPLKKQLLTSLEKEHGKAFIEEWSFFEILDSSYLQFLTKQGLDIINYNDRYLHLVIVTTEFLIDFVAIQDPVVTDGVTINYPEEELNKPIPPRSIKIRYGEKK